MAGSRDLEDCSHPSGTVPRDPPACCLLRRQQTEHTAELDRALGSLFPPLPSTEGNSLRDHVICIRSPSQGGRELGSKLSCFLIQSGCPEPEVLKLEKASTCPGGLWKQFFFFFSLPGLGVSDSFAFLISSLVMLLLLVVLGPHFQNHPKTFLLR